MIGLVGPMPSGPGVIDTQRAAQIASQVPSAVRPVLLTQETDPAKIVEAMAIAGVDSIQLVRPMDGEALKILCTQLTPHQKIIQVVHIHVSHMQANEVFAYMQSVERYVDMFLLDSGRPNPNLAPEPEELGGTGRTHDWGISAQCVQRTSRPVFLAGGITPDNVREAISTVKPYGVDLCSGLRKNNQLCPEKVDAFMNALKVSINI